MANFKPKRVDKTHCDHGHALEGDNLIMSSKGQKICHTCEKEKRRRQQKKRRDAKREQGAMF